MNGEKRMGDTKNLLIIVNNGMDKAYNQYASYVVAFMAKNMAKIENVTVYYGPHGVSVTKKGNLASLVCSDDVKNLLSSQLDGVSAGDLPDNMELMARFVKDKLGVNIVSCATFNVIDGISQDLEDVSGIEDFITPVKLPDAAQALLQADKVLYF
jgi:predicted peroxiredoxin